MLCVLHQTPSPPAILFSARTPSGILHLLPETTLGDVKKNETPTRKSHMILDYLEVHFCCTSLLPTCNLSIFPSPERCSKVEESTLLCPTCDARLHPPDESSTGFNSSFVLAIEIHPTNFGRVIRYMTKCVTIFRKGTISSKLRTKYKIVIICEVSSFPTLYQMVTEKADRGRWTSWTFKGSKVRASCSASTSKLSAQRLATGKLLNQT